MNLYKYMGADILDMALSDSGFCTFKCSYPKEFNDPYELFLTINFEQTPDLLAFYQDTVGDIPQLPTTCFSTSPAVIPMWAHYAHNHRGVMVEVDEDKLQTYLPEIRLEDVVYQDEPDPNIMELLVRAQVIGKPRYFMFLNQSVFRSAYFTKQTTWAYEKERRLVSPLKNIDQVDDLLLLKIPTECINSLIIGSDASAKTIEKTQRFANQINAQCFQMKIGKTSPQPYFLDSNARANIFKKGRLTQSKNQCRECHEPLPKASNLCSWCQINERHIDDAMSRNTMRMLDKYGFLDEYVADFHKIGKE